MVRKYLQPKNLLKNVLAALLVLTLSGAYCLFCCQEMKMETAQAESCPLSKTDHCRFSKTEAADAAQTASSANAFECCGLKFNFFVAKLEKNAFPEQAPVLADNYLNFRASAKLVPVSGFADLSYRAPNYAAPARHLKNCVFRI
jgi:hypothetical protein